MKNTIFILLTIVLFVSSNSFTYAQYNLFKSEKVFDLEISGNFNAIFDQVIWRKEEQGEGNNYCRAYNLISMRHTYQGKNQNLIAMARARGWSRLDSDACDFYPIKIKFIKDQSAPDPYPERLVDCQQMFRKKDLGSYEPPQTFASSYLISKKETMFHKTKSLKIVTQCNRNNKSRWARRELGVYKLFEVVSPYSFKTRAANITYRDRQSYALDHLNGPIINSHFSFFIENLKKVASRVGMHSTKIYDEFGEDLIFPKGKIDFDDILKINVFNFLMGNFDAVLTIRRSLLNFGKHTGEIRNLVFIKDKLGNYHPVPYDFDQSINTVTYQEPDISAEIPYVCQSLNRVKATINYFSSIQDKLIQKVATFDFLTAAERSVFVLKINQSMDALRDPKLLKKIYKKSIKKRRYCKKSEMIK